ncbi:hypothetical protein, partial [Clostridioides difficile]|uniref:hypothetical protein n=1 Tax=Clostridioides difficile TaxID=1496 RepID=UPI003A8C38A0
MEIANGGILFLDEIHRLPGLALINISEPTRPGEISYALLCLEKKLNIESRVLPAVTTRSRCDRHP